MTEIEVYDSVIRLDLHRIPEFDTLSHHEFRNIYNGYGSNAWPQWARTVMSWIYRNFPELAAVHDVAYHFGDGTLKGWHKTSDNWRLNSSILLSVVYPVRKFWLLPLRSIAWCKLLASYRVLLKWSYPFYRDCSHGTNIACN